MEQATKTRVKSPHCRKSTNNKVILYKINTKPHYIYQLIEHILCSHHAAWGWLQLQMLLCFFNISDPRRGQSMNAKISNIDDVIHVSEAFNQVL